MIDPAASLFGMPVYRSPVPMRRPKIKLSDRVTVSDAFRAEFDAWLLATFGEEHYAIFMNLAALGLDARQDRALVMDERMFAQLRGLPSDRGKVVYSMSAVAGSEL